MKSVDVIIVSMVWIIRIIMQSEMKMSLLYSRMMFNSGLLYNFSLFNLRKLEHLDIAYNRISFIPNEIKKLKYVTFLCYKTAFLSAYFSLWIHVYVSFACIDLKICILSGSLVGKVCMFRCFQSRGWGR